jgi:hypothetical protein
LRGGRICSRYPKRTTNESDFVSCGICQQRQIPQGDPAEVSKREYRTGEESDPVYVDASSNEHLKNLIDGHIGELLEMFEVSKIERQTKMGEAVEKGRKAESTAYMVTTALGRPVHAQCLAKW